MFLDSPATSKKGDEKNDTANHYQQYRCVKKAITQKVQVVAVHSLDYATSNDQGKSGNLQKKIKKISKYGLNYNMRVKQDKLKSLLIP